jgi:DNA polymerase-3 subunit gamma/tau
MLAFSQSDTLASAPSGQQGISQNNAQSKPSASIATTTASQTSIPSASAAHALRSATATLNAATETTSPAFVERAPVLANTSISESLPAVEISQPSVEITPPIEVASAIENKVENTPAPISTIVEIEDAKEIFVDTQTASMFGDTPVTQTPPIEDGLPTAGANQFDGNWRGLIDELKLGLARTLALNCELTSFDDNNINLTVPEAEKHLLDATYQDKLSAAIQQHFGRKIKLNLTAGGTGNTPAKQIFEEKAAVQSHAVSAIEQDPFVQALVSDFGAHVIPSSIKPIQ